MLKIFCFCLYSVRCYECIRKYDLGIRATVIPWYFMLVPILASESCACDCLHITTYCRIPLATDYITLPMHGPQASTICYCSHEIVSDSLPLLLYTFTELNKATHMLKTQSHAPALYLQYAGRQAQAGFTLIVSLYSSSTGTHTHLRTMLGWRKEMPHD